MFELNENLSGRQFKPRGEEGRSDIRVEGGQLHIAGKPVQMARKIQTDVKPYTYSDGRQETAHGWRIPFESGHEITVVGSFHHPSGNLNPNMVMRATHKPTGARHYWSQGHDGDLAVANTPEDFHRRVKEIANLHGGRDSAS